MGTRHSIPRSLIIAKFHYTDPTRTGPDTDKVRAHCRRRAKFHYTDPTGPARTRTDFFCGETPLGPCGSGRVRVVEFSFYCTHLCSDQSHRRPIHSGIAGFQHVTWLATDVPLSSRTRTVPYILLALVNLLHRLWLFGFLMVKWLHQTGEVDKPVRFSCEILSGFNTPKVIKIG